MEKADVKIRRVGDWSGSRGQMSCVTMANERDEGIENYGQVCGGIMEEGVKCRLQSK